MSDAISKNSPRSGSNSDDVFDGRAEIAAAWRQGLAPDPALTVSAWADRYRFLSSRASSEAGRYRTDRTPYMRGVMDALSPGSSARRIVFMKAAQVGAPLALDTPIPTAAGWKEMGDLIIGDALFDDQGRVCHVTGVSPVMTARPCHELVFDDGARVICDGAHRWPVLDFTDSGNPKAKLLRTDEMTGRVRIGASARYRFAIDCCAAVDLPEQDLIIHPYVLGLWLGDGSSVMNHVSTHEDDAEIVHHLRACGVAAEFRRPHWRKGKCANVIIDPTFRALGDAGAPASVQHRSRFTTRLRQLDLLENKHIPAQYLRSARWQRLELVRGLMDSDGSITPDGKRCEFSNTDWRLIEGLAELLRSLGYKPSLYRSESRRRVFVGQDRQCLGYWRVSWTAYSEEPMFRLARKIARMRKAGNGRPGKSRRRRIVAINPAPSRPVRCIAVDSPKHIYLCGKGWIATHNTEAGNNWIGYCIHQAPGPFLGVQPTTDLAKRLSQQRIEPLIEESPELRALILPSRSRDSGNTVLAKKFAGGQLVLTGANSAVGLRSMPARYVFLDEVDAYEGDVDGEGDPVALAIARTRTFGHRAKVFLVSTPTIKGLSRIEREFEASDQRRFFVPCPHCGLVQWLKFERLKWTSGEPASAAYHCEGCDQPIAEHHKTAMLSAGEWRATATPADPHCVGFHISGLYSPVGWLSWADIAREWEAAQGDDAALKAAKNTLLGETWQERGEAPDWQRLYERREDFAPLVPSCGLILTAGADVQHDRIEVDIWAWGRKLISALVEHVVLEGDTSREEVWGKLAALLGQTWRHENGARMRIARLAIDSGDGRNTAAVYGWVRRVGVGQALAIKGVDGFDRSTPVDGPTYVDVNEHGRTIRRGVKLWKVSVAVFKSETYRFLRLDRPTDEELAADTPFPDGYVHLPKSVTAEWVKQLVAEQLVTVRDRRGFSKLEWRQMRERNEALDCRVYARAAAWLLGIDRFDDAKFEALEEELRIAAEDEARPADQRGPNNTTAPLRRSDWLGPRKKWL